MKTNAFLVPNLRKILILPKIGFDLKRPLSILTCLAVAQTVSAQQAGGGGYVDFTTGADMLQGLSASGLLVSRAGRWQKYRADRRHERLWQNIDS